MPSSDVEVAIIQPMAATLPAPLHVRGKPAAIETLLNVYRQRAGWLREGDAGEGVAQGRVGAGLLDLAHAGNAGQGGPALPRSAHPFDPRQSEAWVEKAQALTDAAVRRFMRTSVHATRAREGGYEAALKEYVREAAWVQAQVIVGRVGVGYSSHVLFGRQPDRGEAAEFFERARSQAATGHIRVHVAAEKVQAWKGASQAAGRGR